MNKNNFISAVLILLVIVISGFIISPDFMLEKVNIILPLFILMLLLIFVLGFRYLQVKLYNEKFKLLLSDLELKFEFFKKRLYAFGKYKGLYISFKYDITPANDWMPPIPLFNKVVIFCRIKIPETQNIYFHMAVFSGQRSKFLRKTLGWLNPEPGFYIAKMKNQYQSEVHDIFNKLSKKTKEKFLIIADKSLGSSGISKDWESIILGLENSLKLLNNDEDAVKWLDLQFKISFKTSKEELIDYLDLAVKTVNDLRQDLKK